MGNVMAENGLQLTVVATARNDDHGGNLLGRMQLFVSGLLEQCRRHDLRAELVLVEWNPPTDKPRLVEALCWPVESGPCRVRIIEVPPGIHRRFRFSDKLALFQMIAKNVGIRRARGRFVLATNIDILFSDELMRFLASGALQERCMYRVDRYDVPADVPAALPLDRQLDFCRERAFRVCRRDGTRDLRNQEFHRIYPKSRLVRHPVVMGLRRVVRRLLPLRTKVWLMKSPALREYVGPYAEREWLHTNACGDFTLLASEDWFSLRGYPELEMFSLHLDTLFCYMAYHAGNKEAVLPYPIYHVDHTSGWTPQAERDESLVKKIPGASLPRLTYEQLEEWVIRMRREGRPIILNDERWGLADLPLPETTVS